MSTVALNIMRVGGRLKLLDFDACGKFEVHYVGEKYSSAFVPPEMVFLDEQGEEEVGVVRSYVTDEHSMPIIDGLPYDLVKAHPSFDVWSAGITLYHMFAAEPLFLADGDDNMDGHNLFQLMSWSGEYKSRKLAKVKDPQARNFLSLLLSKDPLKRPSAHRALSHPFMSGKKAARLPGEKAQFDVFISYRVSSDIEHAERLYYSLIDRGLTVWWDKKCLEAGKPWEEGFADGLVKSRSFVPLLSREAINSRVATNKRNFAYLQDNSPCDNVLLEYRLAIELRYMGLIDRIFPVLIGDLEGGTYTNYFSSGCHPTAAANVIVSSIETKLAEHLEREGLGEPVTPSLSVAAILSQIVENQGGFVEGGLSHAFDNVTNAIDNMIKSSKSDDASFGTPSPTKGLSTKPNIKRKKNSFYSATDARQFSSEISVDLT